MNMQAPELQRKDLVYPQLSFQIVGALLDGYGALGYGLYEKHIKKH